MATNITPTLFHIGPFLLTWQGLFIAVGLVVGMVVASKALRQTEIDSRVVEDLAIRVIPAAIVGARLFYVADSWNYYAVHPLEIFAVTRGGAAIYGAVIFGTVVAFLFARRRHLPIGPLFDALAPAQAIGLALGRFGDLLSGIFAGRPTTSPVTFRYVNSASPGPHATPVAPAAAYETVWDLAIFGLLIWLQRRGLPRGVAFWLFTGLYGLGRLWTGFLQVEPVDHFGLGQAQILGVIGLALSAISLAVILLKARAGYGYDGGTEQTHGATRDG